MKSEATVYISVTGFRLASWRRLPLFLWLTLRSMNQAKRANGNLRAEGRVIAGVFHTLTVWTDQAAMRAYLVSGAHRQAMAAFPGLGTGRVLGFSASQVPNWSVLHARWLAEGREVEARPRQS